MAVSQYGFQIALTKTLMAMGNYVGIWVKLQVWYVKYFEMYF